MSRVVKFIIYYGYGVVCTTAARDDLNEFQCMELKLTDPQSIRLWQFKSMMMAFLG
jgi:hypothetical protein